MRYSDTVYGRGLLAFNSKIKLQKLLFIIIWATTKYQVERALRAAYELCPITLLCRIECGVKVAVVRAGNKELQNSQSGG